MYSAPRHKVPSGAVPQSAQQKHDHNGKDLPAQSASVSAQGYIYVICEPSGQADMPSAPKVPDRDGGVRPVEILHQVDAQKRGASAGNVRIAGEIAVDLDAKQKHSQNDIRTGGTARIAEHLIHIGCEIVGNDDFFEKTRQQEPDALTEFHRVPGLGLFELGKQMLRSFNGARHKLREKGDEQSVITEMRFRRDRPSVNVQHISEGLKRVKGNAHRKHDAQWEGRSDQRSHESGIFEYRKDAKGGSKRKKHPKPLPCPRVCFPDLHGTKPCDSCCSDQ